jgi:hypothetical protein
MKLKTTRKEIKNKVASNYLWRVGYCDMQNLLYYKNAIAYTSGVYGWNFDLYEVDGVYFTTGYRNMIGKQVDYELLRKYEQQAGDIIKTWGKHSTEEKQELVNNLLKEFIKELYKK